MGVYERGYHGEQYEALIFVCRLQDDSINDDGWDLEHEYEIKQSRVLRSGK